MLFQSPKTYYVFVIISILLTLSRISKADDVISDTSKISTLLKEAQIALDSNRLQESYKAAKSALSISKIINDDLRKAKSLFLIGRIQSNNGFKDSSTTTLKESLILFQKIKNKFEIGNVIQQIGINYYELGNQDSAEFYHIKELAIRKETNDKKGIITCLNSLGNVYFYRANYSKSLEYYFNSLSLLDSTNDRNAQSSAYNNIGGVFWSQGDYSNALEYFIMSLKIKEEMGDIKNVATINNNIGLLYRQLGDYDLALKYFNTALKNSKQIGDSAGISSALLGIGDNYHGKREYSKALESYLRTEEIRKKHYNSLGLANLYVGMGNLYSDMVQHQKAINKFEEAKKIYKKLKNPWGNANSLIQIGLTYSRIGLMQKAIDSTISGISIAKQIGALNLIKEGYSNLNSYYEQTGNINQAYNTYKQLVTFRDSITNIENEKQILKTQLKEEFDIVLQKQQEDQNSKLNLAQNKSIKQTRIANFFILAFAVTLSIIVILVINFRQKQKHNDLLAFQKLDMERQKSELTNQRDELEIQKNLVIHQRDKIITMLTELGESIDYARKIQQALLPSDLDLENTLGQYFLLFNPRESVGGDFYWVTKKENLTYFAVGDCTGHGVPGGFMSMLGVSLLNEIVGRADSSSPAKILWNLREMIIKALNQTGKDEDSQDGMDITFCVYNSIDRTLTYAGANLSLVIVTSSNIEASERVVIQDDMVEFRPDRMPVSFYQRMDSYNEHYIKLIPGDTLYLFSDGFADQFGGPNNKKYGYATFRNLIASVSKQPFDKQKDIFWNSFDRWKGEENQTDDVLVMGIRIT